MTLSDSEKIDTEWFISIVKQPKTRPLPLRYQINSYLTIIGKQMNIKKYASFEMDVM